MSKHTSGPWRVEFSRPCSWLIRSDGVHLPGGYDAGEANARLIAAAPEMLAALRALDDVNLDVGGVRLREIVDAAIAKATGEQL